MRRPITTIIVVVMAIATASIISVITLYDPDTTWQVFTVPSKTMQIITPPEEPSIVPQQIADSNNAFAVDFYRQIASDDDSNIFFSPASIYVAFSVLYEGARGDTAAQIQDVMGLEPDDFMRHNATAHMMSSLNRDDPHATLDMANALWVADWFTLYDLYADIAQSTYLASVQTVNFTDPEDSVKRINQWASDNTNGKIPEVITPKDVDELTVMVINNTIYFNGTWVTQFDVENTRESDFWQNSTTSTTADFMNITGVFGYTESNGAQVLKMPYKGDRLSMLVILPTGKDLMDSFEESISVDAIRQWRQDLRNQEIHVSFPKFETRTNYILNDPLQILGITDIFESGIADLRDVGTPIHSMRVDKAIQDAYVKVDEKGTEAAAVTTFTGLEEALSITLAFRADHPFMFIIQDNESGTILFMGRISDPTS